MGDRANVVVKEGKEAVWLYTHWNGEELPGIVRKVLARKERWDDAPYLARMVFSAMVKDSIDEETGYGIWAGPCDNEHNVIVLDVGVQKVFVYKDETDIVKKSGLLKELTFEQFAGGSRVPEEESKV